VRGQKKYVIGPTSNYIYGSGQGCKGKQERSCWYRFTADDEAAAAADGSSAGRNIVSQVVGFGVVVVVIVVAV
jgi:hypothetical protein